MRLETNVPNKVNVISYVATPSVQHCELLSWEQSLQWSLHTLDYCSTWCWTTQQTHRRKGVLNVYILINYNTIHILRNYDTMCILINYNTLSSRGTRGLVPVMLLWILRPCSCGTYWCIIIGIKNRPGCLQEEKGTPSGPLENVIPFSLNWSV